MKLFKYIFKELKNNRRFCFLFVLNLSLGLSGFITLDAFKTSIESATRGRSKAVLGGDFGISARRTIEASELSKVEKFLGTSLRKTKVIEMFSMVAGQGRRSRLVQLKVIEANYPFYGQIQLQEYNRDSLQTKRPLIGGRGIWIYPELVRQLGVDIGDQVTIGEAQFVINDIISDDAAAGLSTSMAPRIYMSHEQLEQTGLVTKGTIAWHSMIYQLPDFSYQELAQARDLIFKELDSPELRVYTHENVSQQMTRLISQLNDFLGLASLVALFLAGVGTAFLFRSYFRAKTKQVATLICLGATKSTAFFYYIGQVIILGFISALVASLFAVALFPSLNTLTEGLIPFAIDFRLSPQTLMLAFLVGTLGSFFICLPILVQLKETRPIELFIFSSHPAKTSLWFGFLGSLPGLGLFWVMAIWLSHSYQTGSLFAGSFYVATLLLSGFSALLFKFIGQLKSKRLSLRWALRNLSRNHLTSLTCFVAIGLGALLLNLIPQVQAALDNELERPGQSKIPSLFMFDIQEEQVKPLAQVLKSQGVSVEQISPMIRARLMKVNDKNFDKGSGAGNSQLSREEQREMRFRNRGFNLTYREKLSASETLVEGKEFSGPYNSEDKSLPEISLEKRFADRLGLKLGDKLEFDIESIPVVGRVVNLRKVQWTSFQPNFFVQFQAGVLEMAPKTYIATVPSLNLNDKHRLQDLLVNELPNVSMVDVSRIVKRISAILDQMTWALGFMALLCLIAGFVVIYSIANHQATTRRWEIGLLKTLGAQFSLVQAQYLWQFGLVSALACIFGALLSLVMSYILSMYLFDGAWAFNWEIPLLTVALGTIVSLLVTYLATHSALKTKTYDLFS